MTYTGTAAARRALTEYRAGYKGLCLARVRLIFGVPARFGSAQSAWNGAQHKHPGAKDMPVGAPVFWAITSGPNTGLGHIAVYLGNSIVSSTTVNKGYPGEIGLDALTRLWGLTYLGWSEDVNGVRVVPEGAAPPAPQPAPAGGWAIDKTNVEQVKALQRALNSWRAVSPKLVVDGVYGGKTDNAVYQVQSKNPKLFGKPDRVVGPTTVRVLGI